MDVIDIFRPVAASTPPARVPVTTWTTVARGMMTGSWKHLFSRALAAQAPRLTFLAHGHHLWPDVSRAAHIKAWDDASSLAGAKWRKVLGPAWEEAQRHVANELNLPEPSTVTFAGNAHELLVRIFSAMPAKPVRILASRQEFLSAMRQFRRWEETGVGSLTLVDGDQVAQVAAAGHFDLIYLSQVFYDSGQESNWRKLASLARPEGPWVVIDGYHGFMAIPTDLAEVSEHIFYIAGGYKYAMSGEGMGILHAPPGFALRPEITGWFAQADQGDSSPDQPVWFANDARRFLGSTFDPSGLYRFNAVQRMLKAQSLTTQVIAAHVRTLQSAFLDKIDMPTLQLVRSSENLPSARFLAYRRDGATKIGQCLRAQGIEVDARGELLRIGFSIYHDLEDVERLITAFAGCSQACADLDPLPNTGRGNRS